MRSRVSVAVRNRLVGLYLPMVLAAVAMARVWSFTIDDAYISYRYARNLSRGWGLVYNHGERIEGYTNFLWTVILAGVHTLGIDLDLGAKVLGALATLISIIFVYALADRVRKVRAWPCLATWVMASSMTLMGYGVYGLETPLFTALVLGGAWLFLREEERETNTFPWSGLVFGLAGLTRPEAPLYLGLWMLLLEGPRLWRGAAAPGDIDRRVGVVVAVAGAAWLGVAYLHFAEAPRVRVALAAAAVGLVVMLVLHLPKALLSRRNLLRGVVFVAIVGAHLLWRKSYYGAWLPNTLIAKTGDATQQLALGWVYFKGFVGHEGAMLALAIFGCAAALTWRHTELLYAAALTAVSGAYVVVVGGDWMPTYRFFAPMVPFLALLVGVGTRALLERRDRFVSMGVGLLVAVVVLQRWRTGEDDIKEILHNHRAYWRKTAQPTAAWFSQRVAEHGDAARGMIAMGDIGEIGYTTDFPVLDVLGLVDPVVAAQPGGYTRKTGPGFVNHIYDTGPRYIVLITDDVNCRQPHHPTSKAIYYDRRFRRSYAVAHATVIDTWAWCIFERRPDAPR